MKKYASTEKKVAIYEIQDTDKTPLDLINVLTYKDGKLDRVDTFIGRNDRHEFAAVGSAKDLSAPGVLFSYSGYVRQQRSLMPYYIQAYHQNLQGKKYTMSGSSYIVR